MTTLTVEEIRKEWESREGSQKGQYRLGHAGVGVLLERITQLEQQRARRFVPECRVCGEQC